jgi:hypothetical protein
VLIDAKVIERLIQEYFPNVHTHLSQLDIDGTIFYTKWLLCIYTRTLSTVVSIEVWDLVFANGFKALISTALAII